MSNTTSSLQVVQIDPPYYSLHSERAQKLLGKVINMKVEGYTSQHGQDVLPIDTTDFIGSHLILCQRSDGDELKPIMGYKSTKRSDCKRFGVDFPIERIVKEHGSAQCADELRTLFDRCEQNRIEITYDTSWTMCPNIRIQDSLKRDIKDITAAFAVHHHHEFNIPLWLTFGICKYKTDQFFTQWGLTPVSSVPKLKHPFLKDTDAVTMLCNMDNYSHYALSMAEKYSNLWKERIHLLGNRWPNGTVKIAA